MDPDSRAPACDDLGAPWPSTPRCTRVVSLVPSLTESIAATAPERLVGATDWCPADLDVTRVRGTKNPDLAAIAALEPDVVIANQEENRELDVRRLRERGIPVWVTRIESVPEALTSLARLFTRCLDWPVPHWLTRATELWSGPVPPVHLRAAVPIWRDPWMVIGSRTFTGDLLRRLGVENVFAGHDDRYPKVDLSDLHASGADVIVLPDEPYEFTPSDGPDAFPDQRCAHVSGRLLTWYGPSLVTAAEELPRILT